MSHFECVGQAASEILESTCGVKLELQPEHNEQEANGVVIAVISLVGDVDWSIFLGIPRSTAPSLAAKFAGFEIPFESDDMGDAVGELTNILAGAVKTKLISRGIQANISLPSVMRAEGLHVLNRRDAETLRLCFNCPLGPIWTGVIAQLKGQAA